MGPTPAHRQRPTTIHTMSVGCHRRLLRSPAAAPSEARVDWSSVARIDGMPLAGNVPGRPQPASGPTHHPRAWHACHPPNARGPPTIEIRTVLSAARRRLAAKSAGRGGHARTLGATSTASGPSTCALTGRHRVAPCHASRLGWRPPRPGARPGRNAYRAATPGHRKEDICRAPLHLSKKKLVSAWTTAAATVVKQECPRHVYQKHWPLTLEEGPW